MCNRLKAIINSSYNFLNKTVPIIQYHKNAKFLHNLNYTNNKDLTYSKNTFEGYLNCGATCYILSYLLEKKGIKTNMVKTVAYKDSKQFDHVFLKYRDYIIDPTYRQLFRDYNIQKNDLFMHHLYNERNFFFLGCGNKLYTLLNEYENNYTLNYNGKPYNIMKHYENYIDISDKQDLDLVVRDVKYAESKGECFRQIHSILNN